MKWLFAFIVALVLAQREAESSEWFGYMRERIMYGVKQ